MGGPLIITQTLPGSTAGLLRGLMALLLASPQSEVFPRREVSGALEVNVCGAGCPVILRMQGAGPECSFFFFSLLTLSL